MYSYRGKRYKQTELCKKYNLTNYRLKLLEKESQETGESFENLLDKFLVEREKDERLFQKAVSIVKEYTGIVVKTRKELKRVVLEELEMNVALFHGSRTISYYEGVFLYDYAKKGNYMWVVNKGTRQKINFNGQEFSSRRDFYKAYRMIQITFVKNILKYDGDIRKAFLKSEDDPEFLEQIRPIIRGVRYESTNEASIALKFSYRRYRELLRMGYSFDEAYDIIKGKSSKENAFPTKIRGRLYNSLGELSEHLGVPERTLYRKLLMGVTPEQLYEEFRRKPLVVFNGEGIYTFERLTEITGYTYDTIRSRVSKSNLQAWAQEVYNNRIVTDVGVIYSPEHLSQYMGMQKRNILGLWKSTVACKTNAEKLELIQREMIFRQKIATWFTGGNRDFNVKEVAKTLALTNRTLREISERVGSREEFLYASSLIVRRKAR